MTALAPIVALACAAASGTEEGTITLPDGVRLAHTLLHPDGAGPWPTLLVRTSYGRRASADAANAFVQHGIAVLLQDVRGTGKSTGDWTPFLHEAQDGAATFDWLLQQTWCDGRVGAEGMSYLGITAWQMAPHAATKLAAMSIQFSSADVYRDVVHLGGVQGLAIALSWSEATSGNRGLAKFPALPLIEADDASGKDLAVWNDWCRHPLLDDYWKPIDFAPRYATVAAPALLVAGWYDLFQAGQIDDYMALSARTGPPERSFTRLIVGPWDHGGPGPVPGRPDLGPEAYVAPVDEQRLFFARFLLGAQNGFEKKAGVRAFFLGENAWHELSGWPPPEAVATHYFLGGGHALLAPAQLDARAAEPDAFAYDPTDPCPSYASNLWQPLSSLADQAEIGARKDVVIYQTAPLEHEVRIAGPLTLEVWIASDAPDTDVAAKLVDVAADGGVEWRGEGIQRARTRDGAAPDRARLLEAGVPARLVVKMGHVAARFAAGHRIALHVTSSNFPRFSRNLNTEEPSNVAKEPRVARNQLLHDAAHPSQLVLWQLPAAGQ